MSGKYPIFPTSGVFTPTLAFATAGDTNIVYSVRVGRYIKLGNQIWIVINITTTTFTHTTAAGLLRINGLPFTGVAEFQPMAGWFDGYTAAAFTQIVPVVYNTGVAVFFKMLRSGGTGSLISVTEHSSGTNVDITVCGTYEIP